MCHWFSALSPRGETGNFSNCTFGSLKICKMCPNLIQSFHIKHILKTWEFQSQKLYLKVKMINTALVKSTRLALMSLEIQNRRLSPGIIVVKPRFKAPNSQTNAPSSSLSLVSPTFTPARLGVGGHLLGYQKMPGSDAYLPSHGTGSAWVGRNVCLFKKWTEYFPWLHLGNKPSYRGQISIRTLDERLFECFIPLQSTPLPPITHWYMLHNL